MVDTSGVAMQGPKKAVEDMTIIESKCFNVGATILIARLPSLWNGPDLVGERGIIQNIIGNVAQVQTYSGEKKRGEGSIPIDCLEHIVDPLVLVAAQSHEKHLRRLMEAGEKRGRLLDGFMEILGRECNMDPSKLYEIYTKIKDFKDSIDPYNC